MSITAVKVLRTISKIVLLIVGIGIIGYGGLMIYKSVINKPQRVRITNVTDSAATITWVTDNPVRGVVYYKDEGSFLPGPLSVLGSKVAYDDRDFAKAQDECVKAFNENAKNTKDEDFAVDGNNFDCENIPVEKLGAYYTHSVTIKDLENSSTYFFVVGNGIWSWSVDGVDKDVSENDLAVTNSFNFKTGKLLEKIPTPNIAYGTVYAGVKSEEGYLSESASKDSLVYAYLVVDGKNSQVISSVTNTAGGWIFDKSNFRDTEGNLITDLSKAKMMVRAQYEDVKEARWVDIESNLDKDTVLDLQGNLVDDLTDVEKNRILERFEQLVGKVYAVGPDKPCPSPLRTITDDSTYTCDKDCDSDWSVSGCGVGSSCMKKCTHVAITKYGKWENRDWVKFGTVPGTCNVPSVCGECSDGDVENDKKVCKHRNCQAGNWSDWKDGLSDGSACVPTGGDDCTSEELGDCKNGKKCKLVNGFRKWVADTSCVNQNDCTSDELGDCKNGEKCKLVNGYRKWVSDTSCEGGTTGDKCLDGTGVGKCNIYGGYCEKAGDRPVADDKCFCDDNGVDRKPGQCVQSVGKECKLNSSGLPSASGSSCSGNSGEQCTVKPTYYTDGNVDGCTTYTLYGCHQICGSVDINYNTKAKCLAVYPNIKEEYVEGGSECTGNRERSEDQDVNINEIDLDSLSVAKLKELIASYPALKNRVENKRDSLKEEINNWQCSDNGNVSDEFDSFKKYCQALGGRLEGGTYDKKCLEGENKGLYEVTVNCEAGQARGFEVVSKVYAEDPLSDYVIYLPEYGMYSFELGDYQLKTETTDGETYYIFYIEANDKAGFQAPEDPDNPTPDEDIMLKSNSAQIQHEKIASAQTYTLDKGINIISFNFIPVSTELGTLTAAQVIEQAAKKNVDIQYISSFEGGRWAKGYTCKNDKCSGNDFNIIPGKGYLVYVTKGGDISIGGYDLKSSIPVNLSGGWNLVGIHGYKNAYTAASLIESINKVEGLTSDNVTWWPTSKAMYEGLQVTGTQQYGFDFPISPTNGYFVRISSFKPEDAECKSLLWNEGGTLNGACGVTK